jgi:NAD(P)-dependent dehydrogenase (short-subunit alcohol dehydrogenase family)
MNEKVVLITGVSSGIGKACAELLANGYRVFGTTRRLVLPDTLRNGGMFGYGLLTLDVCSTDDVSKTVSSVIKKAGRIDVLVNNAGFGIAGPLEDTSIEDIKTQLEVNLFGALRMCQAVVPIMRKQGGGLIINISSIGGILSLPFQSAYCASKFALEAATRAMRMELKHEGVRFVLVRPGDCCTGFTDRRKKINQISPVYKKSFSCSIEAIEKNERAGMDPEKVAKVVKKIIETPYPKASYVVGAPTEKLAIFLQKVLPAFAFDRLLMGFYNMPKKA